MRKEKNLAQIKELANDLLKWNSGYRVKTQDPIPRGYKRSSKKKSLCGVQKFKKLYISFTFTNYRFM